MLAGGMLREGTTAFFTRTVATSSNSFTTAVVNVNTPSITSFNVSNLVPGDFLSTTGTITGSSGINVNYFLTTWADTNPTAALVTDTTKGLQMVVFRCGTVTAPVTCASATTFETVTGVMNQAATQRITTTGGVPTAPAIGVSGTNLVFTSGTGNVTVSGGGTVTAVPVLTKNNPNTQAKCSTNADGSCYLGGFGTAAVASKEIRGMTSGSNTVSAPAISAGSALGGGQYGLLAGIRVPPFDRGYDVAESQYQHESGVYRGATNRYNGRRFWWRPFLMAGM